MKVAILTTDSREHRRQYAQTVPGFGTAPQGLIKGFELLGDSEGPFEIHVISCAQQPMTSPVKLSDKVFFHSLHVPKAGWLRSGYVGCIRAVGKLLRAIEPDIVHAQGTERDCAISGIFFQGPKLLTIHGNLRLIRRTVGFRPFSASWIQSFLEGFVVPRFDGIVCISHYTDEAIRHEVPRTWVVPNAVDPSFFLDPQTRPGSSTGRRPTVLVVANIEKRKNQNAFIRMAKELQTEVEFEVRFFGSHRGGDYSEEFFALIEENKEWCSFGGMLSRPALREEFQQASILALPTLEDNCPMVVLEAQAAGVPVIATNVGGIPDLISHEATGLLAPASRPDIFRGSLQRLLRDPALRDRLAVAGCQKARTVYHPAIIARRHLQIYRELTGSR